LPARRARPDAAGTDFKQKREQGESDYVIEDDHADVVYNALPEAGLREATGEEE